MSIAHRAFVVSARRRHGPRSHLGSITLCRLVKSQPVVGAHHRQRAASRRGTATTPTRASGTPRPTRVLTGASDRARVGATSHPGGVMAGMPRAPKKCAHASCEERLTGRTFCAAHQPINWAKGASRTSTPEHRAWRKDVLKRDRGSCQIKGPRCIGRATEADHVVNVARGGAEFDLSNGQAACVPCHKAKTLEEATEGRRIAAKRT